MAHRQPADRKAAAALTAGATPPAGLATGVGSALHAVTADADAGASPDQPDLTTPPRSWLTPVQAAQYLSISRQTLYRLIGRGDLVPDGKVGSRMRFSVNHLDQFVQGGTLNPSVDTRPERSSHAHTKTEAEVCRAGNQERWPQPVPGASRLERRQNGPEKECTESMQHNGRGSGVQGKARRGHKKPARTDTVLRLRRAMGLD